MAATAAANMEAPVRVGRSRTKVYITATGFKRGVQGTVIPPNIFLAQLTKRDARKVRKAAAEMGMLKHASASTKGFVIRDSEVPGFLSKQTLYRTTTLLVDAAVFGERSEAEKAFFWRSKLNWAFGAGRYEIIPLSKADPIR